MICGISDTAPPGFMQVIDGVPSGPEVDLVSGF